MKVRMTQTLPGAEDGIHVRDYVAGTEYEMGEVLASLFLGCGAAVKVAVGMPVESHVQPDQHKTKKAKGPSENK